MGGDDSQKPRPWRGIHSSPGHSKPPAHSKINCNGKLRWGCRGVHVSWQSRVVAQLQTVWVIFGKQPRVTSRKRRRPPDTRLL
jgi:hypothetical protein